MSSAAASVGPGKAPEQLSDEEIIDRVLAGDRELFGIVMQRYNRRLFRATRSIVEDDAEAEDVMQEAYVRAYSHLGDFEGRSKFSTWLTRIAIHEALSRKKKGDRFDRRDVEGFGEAVERPLPDHEGRDPEQRAIDGQLRGVIENAIDQLPMHYRMVFVLRDVQEMNTAETAECLGIQEQAVKTRLHRARIMLKDHLATRFCGSTEQVFNFLGARCDRMVATVLSRVKAIQL